MENAETAEEITLCSVCGENPCTDDGEICEKCLAKMRNTKIPLIGWMAAAVSVIVGIVAAVTAVLLTAPSIYVISAENAARDNRWSDANYYYTQMSQTVDEFKSLINWEEGKEEPVLRRLFSVGTKTRAKMFEAYAKAYNPMVAINKIIIGNRSNYDEVLEQEKSLIENERVAPYWDIFTGILYTEELVTYSEEYPEEENYENFIKFYELIEKQEGTDLVYTAYMKYVLASAYDKPVEEQKNGLICATSSQRNRAGTTDGSITMIMPTFVQSRVKLILRLLCLMRLQRQTETILMHTFRKTAFCFRRENLPRQRSSSARSRLSSATTARFTKWK